MKKQMKSLIIGLVAVLALVGVLVVLMVMPEKEPETSSSSTVSAAPSTTVELLKLALDDMVRVDVKNTEEYFFVRDPEDESSWIIEELKGLPKVKNAYAMLALNMCSVKAQDTIEENAADLSIYGLKDPVSTVTVTMKDGSKHTLEVGNQAPGGSGYTYAKMAGSNTVYVVNTSDVSRYHQVKTDYISTTLVNLTANASTGEVTVPTIMKMEISGTAHEDTIKIEQAENIVTAETDSNANSRVGFSSHLITEPKLRDISTYVFTDYVQSIFNTAAEEIVAYNVTEADLAQYGLDTPYTHLKASYQEAVTDASGKSTTKNGYINFRISEPDAEGSFYLMYDEVPVVYKATVTGEYESMDNIWTKAGYSELASRLFVLPMINSLDSVTVTTPDAEYLFDLTLVGKGTDDEKLNIHYDGKAITEEAFKKFYQVMIGATAEDLVTDDVQLGEMLCEFTYKYDDKGHKDDVVTYYKGPTRYVYVAVNGEVEFTTRSAFVDKIYDSIPKVLENEVISPNW